MEHVHSVSKVVVGKCLPQPSLETGGDCLTIVGALVAPARRRHGVGEVGLDYHGKRRLLPACEVCAGLAPGCSVTGYRQCWGCGVSLHRVCAGLEWWPEGPFYCANCCKAFASSGLRDITLDDPLMHVVCGGDPAGLKESDQEQCTRVATWWEWLDG